MTVIAVFGSSTTSPGSEDWNQAVWLGSAIAARGWAVATGGYGGTMEAVSAGAATQGGRVYGVTAPDVFPTRAGANPHVTDEIPESSITARIARLVDMSDAAIALPGSIGTLAELMVAWNVAFLAPVSARQPYPVVTVGLAWQQVVTDLSRRLSSGSGFVVAKNTVTDAWAHIADVIPENEPAAE